MFRSSTDCWQSSWTQKNQKRSHRAADLNKFFLINLIFLLFITVYNQFLNLHPIINVTVSCSFTNLNAETWLRKKLSMYKACFLLRERFIWFILASDKKLVLLFRRDRRIESMGYISVDTGDHTVCFRRMGSWLISTHNPFSTFVKVEHLLRL